MTLIDEALIQKLEEENPKGLTSPVILGFFELHGVAFSEATLRKYVQFGLLPRSVRVGEKGKHRGSKGMYPVRVLRQILWIKSLLAENYTIPQIQTQFLFLRAELDDLETSLDVIITKLRSAANPERKAPKLNISREISAARGVGRDLLVRLRRLEGQLGTSYAHQADGETLRMSSA